MLLKPKLNLNSAIQYGNSRIRLFATQVAAQAQDVEYENAKSYEEIPGPSKVSFLLSNLPGGKYFKLPFDEIFKLCRTEYGNVSKLPGLFGQPDVVLTFDPNHFQKIYRTEGTWPHRQGLQTMEYYRTKLRPEIFGKHQGLINSQEQKWGEFRTTVNPIMMKPNTTKLYVPTIDLVVTDFVNRIRDIRNPSTMQVPDNFEDELNRWALESIGTIALDTRLGLISDEYNERAKTVIESVKTIFELAAQLEFKPSIWKIVKTPDFNRMMKALDNLTNASKEYIEEAKKRFESLPESKQDDSERSVLEKLLKIDPVIAQVMAMDMFFAGVDTTSSAFVGLLYMLAKNPDKQETLRQEIFSILPEKDTPLTVEKMSRMPYLRACIKESIRLYPVVIGNGRGAGQDMVLNGYQVPKGKNILMPSPILQREDGHFPNAAQFIPERWLKDVSGEKCPASAKSAHPFIYLPFGFGPRMCIGRRLAEMEIEILTTRIVRNFFVKWEHPDLKFKMTSLFIPDGKLLFTFNDIRQ